MSGSPGPDSTEGFGSLIVKVNRLNLSTYQAIHLVTLRICKLTLAGKEEGEGGCEGVQAAPGTRMTSRYWHLTLSTVTQSEPGRVLTTPGRLERHPAPNIGADAARRAGAGQGSRDD